MKRNSTEWPNIHLLKAIWEINKQCGIKRIQRACVSKKLQHLVKAGNSLQREQQKKNSALENVLFSCIISCTKLPNL